MIVRFIAAQSIFYSYGGIHIIQYWAKAIIDKIVVKVSVLFLVIYYAKMTTV